MHESLFAVAVKGSDIVVDHVPKEIPYIRSSFWRRGGTITCSITRARHYSADLPQGRLQVSMLIDKVIYVSKVGKLIKAAVKSDKPDTKFSWCLTKIITSSPLNSQQSAISLIGKVWYLLTRYAWYICTYILYHCGFIWAMAGNKCYMSTC